jgi:hypothetical protein
MLHVFHLLLHLPQTVLGHACDIQNREYEPSDKSEDHSDNERPKQNSE